MSLYSQFIRKLHIPNSLPYDITAGIIPLFGVNNLAEICHYRATLIEKLNSLVSGTEFQDDNIYRIITRTAQIPSHALLFNYASQSWNLDFFLQSLKSNDSEKKKIHDNNDDDIDKSLNMKITDEFRSLDLFKEHFANMALAIFGSGWTWLVKTEYDTLRVVNTYNAGTTLDITRLQQEDPNNYPSRFNKKKDKNDANQNNNKNNNNNNKELFSILSSSPSFSSSPSPSPSSSFSLSSSILSSPFQEQDNLTSGNQPLPPPLIKLSMELPHNNRLTPLLCLNVWEHAYVKQYGISNKSSYIENFWKCVNWEVVNNRFRDVSS